MSEDELIFVGAALLLAPTLARNSGPAPGEQIENAIENAANLLAAVRQRSKGTHDES